VEQLEHENAYAWMMDALDGALTESNQHALESHLSDCAECQHEWQALLAIDTLFRQAPMLSPAAGFTQRTLARLPDRRYRVWAITSIYAILLLGGMIPLAIGIYLVSRLAPVLTQPALFQSVWASLVKAVEVSGTVLLALLNSVGEVILQQPTLIGWLLVMIGIVAVWGGVYRQLVGQSRNF
jgi:anti-sigma factor RsiW